MERLKKIIKRCKCSVGLDIDQHKDHYKTTSQALEDLAGMGCLDDVTPEIIEKMKANDTIIQLQIYPDTPVGFYVWFHYDLDMLLDEAVKWEVGK